MNVPSLRLTEDALREPLRRVLAARTPKRIPHEIGTAAAVLVPLFEKGGETHVWLVRRPTTMRSHSGQVAFPGGKQDPADASLLATALRETHEEVGLAAAQLDVLGALDDYVTITRFVVTPFVAWVAPGALIVPNASEVARAFAAPLRTFFDEPTGTFPFKGYDVDGERVWGATAAMLRGLVSVVRECVAQ
jgi:8-oxo-dGTP pyrophosphatase MutT (NUDIX family)